MDVVNSLITIATLGWAHLRYCGVVFILDFSNAKYKGECSLAKSERIFSSERVAGGHLK